MRHADRLQQKHQVHVLGIPFQLQIQQLYPNREVGNVVGIKSSSPKALQSAIR